MGSRKTSNILNLLRERQRKSPLIRRPKLRKPDPQKKNGTRLKPKKIQYIQRNRKR